MTDQQKIVHSARIALLDDRFERQPGYCQRLAREVIQHALGAKFDKYWRDTAEYTRVAFIGSPFYHVGLGDGLAGDLLYFAGSSNQTMGHVVINVGGGLVVQNSVTDAYDKATGHKGTRKLSALREPSCIVRLW